MIAVRAGVAITHRDQLPSSSRYELLVKIASGGMATVYVGRLSSAVGITRLVAIKRAHAHLLEDPAFGRMLIAEAKLASRIHHPNVVAVHNVEEIEGELLLVMDYVEGASLADLGSGSDETANASTSSSGHEPLPPKVAARIVLDACAGLNAAHELTDDDGQPLGIVHRDVSPHNILVGVDGIARLTDFGIAKSSGGHTQSAGHRTSTGALKGKVAYMAPEYVESGLLDARSDVFSLGIVAWEALTRERLFRGATEVESLKLVLATEVPRASRIAPWVGKGLDAVLEKALARSPSHRFSTAAELGEAFEAAARKDDLLAKHSDVAAYVRTAASEALAKRRALVRERHDTSTPAPQAAGGSSPQNRGGRVENTASLGAHNNRSEVRARDGETSPDVSSSPDVAEDANANEHTIRIGDTANEHLGEKQQSERTSHGFDPAATFGSGVSAQLVNEARTGLTASRITPKKRSALLWSVAAACVVAAGIGAIFVVPTTRSSSSPSSNATDPAGIQPSSSSPSPTQPPSSSSPPTASVAVVEAPSATSALSVATRTPPPPPPAPATGGTPHTRPTALAAAPLPPAKTRPAPLSTNNKPSSIIKTLPPDPPPPPDKPAADKAPPNPYGK